MREGNESSRGYLVTRPRVSILTPSFNQDRWLTDNLQSVDVQSYPAIEHVVMDGGSTDRSLEILRSGSPRLVWDSAPDHGQSDAINKAFEKSTGDIIGWLNSDDAYFSRTVVAKAVDVFEHNPEVGLVYGHAVLVNATGTPLQVIWAPPFARAVLRAYDLISQPTVFIRRSVLGRKNLVDPNLDYMMDWELWLHLARRTGFHRLNSIVALDRHHMQRKSYTRLDLAAHDMELISREYRVPPLAANRVLLKTVTVGLRFAGLSKIREASRGSDALALEAASAREMAVRQVARLRRWMPSGDL
jgi:glycosyltransferase involved in cell wall biosynthesis